MDFLISDYQYDLPASRISQLPLAERDQSKLLIYKHGQIGEDVFRNIAGHLPERGLLMVNDTRVIHARLLFRKPTGALVEIFCLNPVAPVQEIQTAFALSSDVQWKCLIGNAKRWKQGFLEACTEIRGEKIRFTAERINFQVNPGLVRFSWTPVHFPFSEVLDAFGKIPLPPYIQREPQPIDTIRYQTLYARTNGSVAAPTAGLHFSEHVFQQLKIKQIDADQITLHVGAGTFTPVTSEMISDHIMHPEWFSITRGTILSLYRSGSRQRIIVGTTTVRALESLYWYGVRLIRHQGDPVPITIGQWDPYARLKQESVSAAQSLEAVLEHMEKYGLENLYGETRLMIIPGYRFRFTDILITNFHQPRSTLLLLVAAFIGTEWKRAYQYALDHDFRFLSYGDSCLFYGKGSLP
ncbi:MAG: S-adenosylmethionine:tRNA ribosyltransferase-isomerase [Bacteroidales bacterium]|nr:S-adenosylmethionine:tRNA ribosyltransferase-isomerase [Bacteroidales bacterium]